MLFLSRLDPAGLRSGKKNHFLKIMESLATALLQMALLMFYLQTSLIPISMKNSLTI